MPDMRVLCVGQLVADVLAKPIERLDYGMDTMPISNLSLLNGGDAMNVAVNLSRLGADTSFIGRVGRDEMGAFLRRRLIEVGVDASGLIEDGSLPSDSCLVLVRGDGARAFFYCAGANAALVEADVPDERIPRGGIVHIGGTFLLKGLDGDGAAELFRRAKAMGCLTSMDVTHDITGRWMDLIRPSLTELDYFLPSEAEASKITGKTTPEDIAAVLIDAGVRVAVIKLGSKGCYVRSRDGEAFYQPAYPIEPVDTTGAGDAFVSGFLRSLTLKKPLRECARLGCAAGAVACRSLGATTAAMSMDALDVIINS